MATPDVVRRAIDEGISDIKLYYDSDEASLWRTLDDVSAIAGEGHVAVDASWRLTRRMRFHLAVSSIA